MHCNKQGIVSIMFCEFSLIFLATQHSDGQRVRLSHSRVTPKWFKIAKYYTTQPTLYF